ncbi:hypothetical protein EGR_07117 [Echinococcus granulosus]|uniref:Uncharacterized protein n=1 Tax=Echinococcus granulosus TaxID=6210 RepID=W6UBS9_ECHGR|nr:hypothetical protein EGR_07117 [Echinococcus granulosus]EUB58011.1 hypothetical protein EGR_07117 [Echinococcus granulosus]
MEEVTWEFPQRMNTLCLPRPSFSASRTLKSNKSSKRKEFTFFGVGHAICVKIDVFTWREQKCTQRGENTMYRGASEQKGRNLKLPRRFGSFKTAERMVFLILPDKHGFMFSALNEPLLVKEKKRKPFSVVESTLRKKRNKLAVFYLKTLMNVRRLNQSEQPIGVHGSVNYWRIDKYLLRHVYDSRVSFYWFKWITLVCFLPSPQLISQLFKKSPFLVKKKVSFQKVQIWELQ